MDALKTQIKIPTRTRKDLVEDFPMLSVSSLGRGLLHKGDIKRGALSLTDWTEWPRALYETEHLDDGSTILHVSFQRGASQPPLAYQEITLEGINATYGKRPYMTCNACGSLRLKLLFTRTGGLFCRSCLALTYQCCRENHSKAIFIGFRRHQRLRMKQLGVKRVDYAGKLTRKARSVIRMTKKWVPRRRVDGKTGLEYTR